MKNTSKYSEQKLAAIAEIEAIRVEMATSNITGKLLLRMAISRISKRFHLK